MNNIINISHNPKQFCMPAADCDNTTFAMKLSPHALII